MSNILSLYIINVLSFFIFFIGVPYWTGEELSELYPKPIYKCVFSIFMQIGHLAYRVVETIISGICEGLMSQSRLLSGLLTMGVYTAILYFASGMYENIMASAIPVISDVVTDTSKYSKLSDAMYIYQLWGATGGAGFLHRIAETARYVMVFSLSNLFYFGVLYGFIQYKVMELNVLKPVSSLVEAMDEKISSLAAEDASDDNPIVSAICEIKIAALRLIQCPLDFCSRFRIFNSCLVGGSGIVLLLVILAYTVWSVLVKGATADWSSFAANVYDRLEVANIVFSLVITLVEMLLINIVCSLLYRVAPSGVKSVIDIVVETAASVDEKLRDGREVFASTRDYSFRESGDSGPNLHNLEL